MHIYYSFDEDFEISNPVVTIGTFDGVHAGHRAILKRLNILSQKVNGESVLITFYPHPRKVLYPDTLGKNLKMICTQNEKIHLLQETKLNHLFIIHFTNEFSKITAEQFVRNFLVNKLHARVIVVGFNHHFGYDKQGDYEYLYELQQYFGFQVEEIPQQEIEKETVSSTRIRQALSQGLIQKANAYLQSHFPFFGVVTEINPLDNKLTKIKIKTDEIEKIVPPIGLYAGVLQMDIKKIKCLIITNEIDENIIPFIEIIFQGEINITLGDNVRAFFAKELQLYDKIDNLHKSINEYITLINELIY
ncbi:MAG: FAD synthetase family protein [Bacteroidales bacterium]|jgi:riboflavin kinase/FMN adenylyltransferase|nr:FAD synthetase family protein [Bacteroidales bacterium]MDI9576049.1 FAD synthetase family protein [Bacteroidota bacterium]MDY0400279.1 FAD synthetase family protein [Bacteroidales bacterium]HHW58788.1 FAD synthetase family protein [Bacteroidales bacterium]HOB77065.1 FAD synthetase family protein [Bacteroidales bacterium]